MISRFNSREVNRIKKICREQSINIEITQPEKEDFYAWIYANTQKFYNPRTGIYERPLL